MQVNMHLRSFEGISEFNDLQNLLVPLIWIEEVSNKIFFLFANHTIMK